MVRSGILTDHEFEALSPAEAAMLERTTLEMLQKHGQDWLRQQRHGLRQELLTVL
jgi:hypothetical protein